MASRFRVEKVEVGNGPCGPDHPWRTEHRVVEVAMDRVVLAFEERPDLSRPWDPSYEGVASVSLEHDGAHVVVRYHDGRTERVALPP